MVAISTIKRHSLLFYLTVLVGCSAFCTLALGQPLKRSDEAVIESDIERRLQSKLDILAGTKRTIVNVDVTLADRFTDGDIQKIRGLARLAGVRMQEQEESPLAFANVITPMISSMHIIIDADDSLSPELLGTDEEPGLIKTEVAKWAGLDPARGDTIRVVPKEWYDIVQPPTAMQQNYLLYSMLALVALLILIAAIYFPLRKLKTPKGAVLAAAGVPGAEGTPAGAAAPAVSEEERKKRRKDELEEIKQMFTGTGADNSEVLAEIRSILEQGLPKTPMQVDVILQDIKELLAKTPAESDTLLTEIRDTLSDMLDEQRKIAALGGIAAGSGAAAAGPAAAGPAAAPRAAAAPAAEGGGPGMGGEIVEALGNIEELMAQQLEKTPETGVLDEPFKYLKTLPPEDIVMLIEDEEPKLAGAVLSQIDPKAAADVLDVLDEDKRFEIAQAMTGLTETEDMAEDIKSFLERKLKIVRLHKDYVPVLGFRVLADILSSSRYAVAKVLLDKMESKNPAMAGEIRKRMFLFEDIVTLEDKDLEVVLHNIPRELISYALVDASEEIKGKIFSNMTDRARDMIREDMESFQKVEIEKEGKELSFNEAMLTLDQSTIEEIFRTVDRNTLKMALRGASDGVQEKFFSGLTERAVAMLKEDLEVMGAISRKRADEAQDEIMELLRRLSSQILQAQHEVIATIRKLEREGQITVSRFEEEMV